MKCTLKIKSISAGVLITILLSQGIAFGTFTNYSERTVYAQEDSEFLQYENTEAGISIKYPSNWQMVEKPDEFALVSFDSPLDSPSDEFTENVRVSFEGIFEPITLDELVDATIQGIVGEFTMMGIEVNILDSESITISGNKAKKTTYTLGSGDFILKQAMFITIKGSTVYSVVFTAEEKNFSDHIPTVQKMIDSISIESMGASDTQEYVPVPPPMMPQMVSGKYVNSDAGMEIEFPAELAGLEITFPKNIDSSEVPAELQGMPEIFSGVTMVMMLPADFDPVKGGGMMMVMIMETSSVETFSEFISQTAEGSAFQSSDNISDTESQLECDTPNQTILEINGMKAAQINSECYDPTTKMEITMSMYMFVTDEHIISPMYMIPHDPDGKSDLSVFEDSLDTLKIEDTLDISDPHSYAELFGLKVTKENIMIENKSHEIEIVSDSSIANFSFDEKNREMSFELLKDDTTTALGSTEVYLDNSLNAPYTVTVDGIVDDTFVVTEDKTTGQTSINVSYLDPVEKISIKESKANTSSDTPIPDWIRNNAKWWVDGTIDEKSFVGGIQFLIKEGIIQIPETTQSSQQDQTQEIPAWVKNNADWWSQGLISDDDFLKGIQFMVEQGIIQV